MGRLSAEDYRRQRDELLAAANAGQAPAAAPTPQAPNPATPGQGVPGPMTPGGGFAGPGTPGGGTPMQGQAPTGTPPGGFPGQQQQPATPFPPAFKWEAQPPSSERTQTMHPVGGGSDPTQVVPGGAGGMDQHTQAVRPGDPDRTQVVHNNPFGQPQQQSPWPGNDQSGLYSSEAMPNWNTAGAFGDWPKQGPEVFDNNKPKRGRIFAIVGAVIVVALVVAGILVFKPFGGGAASPQAGVQQTTQTSTSHPKPTPKGPLASVPGTPIPATVQNFGDVAGLGFLTAQEISIIQTGTPTKPYFKDVKDGPNRVLLLAVKEDNGQDAASAASQLSALETQYGLKSSPAAPTGVYLGSSQTSTGWLLRAEYSSGAELVRVEVSGKDSAATSAEMNTVLAAQLAKLPVEG